jgi:hypothetical protein
VQDICAAIGGQQASARIDRDCALQCSRIGGPISDDGVLGPQEGLGRLPPYSVRDVLVHLSPVQDGEDPHLIATILRTTR